jgi:hypothetical protein
MHSFGTTGNYSAIADLHTWQFSVAHTASVYTDRWQWIHNSLTLTAAQYEVFFAQPNFFLAISSQLFYRLQILSQFSATASNSSQLFSQSSTLNWLLTWNSGTWPVIFHWTLLYNHLAQTENAISNNTPVVCLLIHCLETGSCVVACIFIAMGICLLSHSLAVDISSGFQV